MEVLECGVRTIGWDVSGTQTHRAEDSSFVSPRSTACKDDNALSESANFSVFINAHCAKRMSGSSLKLFFYSFSSDS